MTAVAAFTLTSPVSQAAAPFMIGHAFKRGDVPAGQYLAVDLANFSIVPLRTWNDGSLKHCAIIGRAVLSANVARQVNITRSSTTSAAGTLLTAASITAAAPAASVQCGTYGTVNLSSLLASPKRTFISTKEMVECHYAAKVGSDASLYVIFHVRLYADGRMWVRAIVGCGYLNGTEKVQKDYIPSINIGGVTAFNNSGIAYKHSYTARYDVTSWIGTDPQVTPRHDTGYLNRTMLIPNYWKVGPTQTVIDNWIPFGIYVPGSNLNYTAGMGAGGAQNQIGLLPKWDALYCTSQGHQTLFKAVVAHASAINSYGIVFADTNTLDPARISDFPTWSYSGPGGSGTNDFATVKQDGTALTWEPAHFPSAGYLAYLLTADYYYMESCAYNALAVYLVPSSATGSGTARRVEGQNRGRAWTYRSVGQIAAIYPSSMAALFGDYRTWMNTIAAQKQARYTVTTTATSQWLGYEDFFYNRLFNAGSLAPNGQLAGANAPWEHHFTTSAVGHAYDAEPCDSAGMASLLAFRNYVDAAPVWILGGQGATEYNFGYANSYSITVRITSATTDGSNPVPYTDFISADAGVIFKDTFSTSTVDVSNATTNHLYPDEVSGAASNPTGYFANMLPAIAASVDHGKTGAAVAFTRLTGADNFSDLDTVAGFANEPMWGIVPRSYVQPALLFTPVDTGAIVPTPGPSFVWDTVSLLTGAFVWGTYRGLGIPASDIATGFAQPSLLEDDIDVADPAGTEYRWEATTGPGGGTWVIYPDSSFSFSGPDGSYGGNKLVWKNGAYDPGTYSFTIGVPSTVTGVSVSPSTATGSTTFAATVAGTSSPSQVVTWSTTGGSINSGGAFTQPAATGSIQTITITATSAQDPTKSGTATVTIAAASSTVTGVTVAPPTAVVPGGTNITLAATVAGLFSPSQAVTWTTTAGSVNSGGTATAPAATSTIQTVTVTATSNQDPTKSGTATLTVPVALAPRFARPNADVAAGPWLPSSGSTMYTMIDESVADSADYIMATSAGTATIALNPVADPGTSINQIVRYQAWAPSGSGVTVRLMMGTTVIASWIHTSLPTIPTIYSQTLTGPQCDSITDYTTLRFEFVAG